MLPRSCAHLMLIVSMHIISLCGLIYNCILSHTVNFNHNMSINVFTDKEISLLFDMFVTKLHERPDGCWCRIKLGHLVFLANGPTSVWTWMEWCAFKLKTKQYVISHTKLELNCTCFKFTSYLFRVDLSEDIFRF